VRRRTLDFLRTVSESVMLERTAALRDDPSGEAEEVEPVAEVV
jgi:hypothetical protein